MPRKLMLIARFPKNRERQYQRTQFTEKIKNGTKKIHINKGFWWTNGEHCTPTLWSGEKIKEAITIHSVHDISIDLPNNAMDVTIDGKMHGNSKFFDLMRDNGLTYENGLSLFKEPFEGQILNFSPL